MKAYTDLSQSKKLAEILPFTSADMKWFIPADNEGEFIEDVSLIKNKSEYYLFDKVTDWNDAPYIPCWSLAALLDILHDYTLQTNSDGSVFVMCDSKKPMISDSYRNPVDACVDMILLLKERSLI